MSVLLFSMNIDIWVLWKMKSIRFKLDSSLNLRKPIKERTSIIINLEFVRFIFTPPRYWKTLFRSELERVLLAFSLLVDSFLILSKTLVMKWLPSSSPTVKKSFNMYKITYISSAGVALTSGNWFTHLCYLIK